MSDDTEADPEQAVVQATERIERALERIAAAAHPDVPAATTAVMTARLDGLIALVKGALEPAGRDDAHNDGTRDEID